LTRAGAVGFHHVTMPKPQGLEAYGLLIGKVTGTRPARGMDSHWVIFVQPANAAHPPYRVAIDVGAHVQFQTVALDKVAGAASLVAALRKRGATDYFTLAEDDASVPRLDYVRGGLGLKDLAAGTGAAAALAKAAVVGAQVAVFGTGSPVDHRSGERRAIGFDGIDHVRMNQGHLNVVNSRGLHLENGPDQDGALIFLGKSAQGMFFKLADQVMETDARGNPTITGIKKIDRTSKAVMAKILARPSDRAPARVAGGAGYVFADPDTGDGAGQFQADNDDGTYRTPFVQNLDLGKTRGPVPSPRVYPTIALSDIVGAAPPGYSNTATGETIAFDIIGDSGPVTEGQLPHEMSVTELLVRNAQSSPPAFLYHVGDVVYFYGEGPFYYGQFFEPFRSYPAPIFAIPGNHDGVTYSTSMVSLQPFQSVFCASAPAVTGLAGGIKRTTMTQPGVYFTLDAPLVSIVGLYSNCGESYGWLDQQQLSFLYNELVRLKQLRAKDGRAAILAIHHCPRWFPGQKPVDAMSTAIDSACTQADFWPDAVICGHAHLYQRIVRTVGARQIPYVITGAGGYGLSADQQLAKTYVKTMTSQLARTIVEYGYVRATVAKPKKGHATLQVEYHSTKQSTDEPDDVCIVDLATNKVK